MKRQKNQIFLIHGGMTFRNERDYLYYLKTRDIDIHKNPSWSEDYLTERLGKNFEIIRPRMPRSENAKYKEWKIHFENHFPLLHNGITLIGSSLGGIFLAKYLSEHRFPKKIRSVYLICPPFDGTLSNEDLVGGFRLKSDLSLLEKNSGNLHLLFSRDDDVVHVSHAEKYRKKLPRAHIILFKSKKGHFRISTFPEIIAMIKSDCKQQ